MNAKVFLGSISALSVAILTLGFSGQTAQAQSQEFSYEPLEIGTQQATPNPTTNNREPALAQTETDVEPGRATRGGSSYIGIGGNIGIGGGSSIGEGSFTVFSKMGLTQSISLRPLVAISSNPTILFPITYDFNPRTVDPVEQVDAFSVSPYAGAGVGIATHNDADVGFLLTGGVDIPISSQFTGTAGVNVLFVDNTDIGINLGIGYNF